MTHAGPVLLASAPRQLANTDPLVTFPTRGGGAWPVWDRYLAVRGTSLFEIGNICHTCEFWFRRLGLDADPIDIDAIQQALTVGIASLDEDVVSVFSELLQPGDYRVALFSFIPERVEPGSPSDYFVNEQRAVWEYGPIDEVNDPRTDYYRVTSRFGVSLNSDGDSGFEFLVPLQLPSNLESAQIGFFTDNLERGARPTAIAAGVLDIKQHYDSPTAHWCLSHYLLDGHHKVDAAARAGRPVTVLSFINCDAGISTPDQIDQLLGNYGQE